VEKIIVLVLWNAFVFAMYGDDKRREITGKFRASENMFVAACFFMGAFGVLMGMIVFHQKLRSPKLILVMPFALLLNLLIGLGLLQI